MSHQLLLPASAEQTLGQAQSLAWVQIFLNASLACISHARALIPWQSPCFRTRYIDQIEAAAEVLHGDNDLYTTFCEVDLQHNGSSQELRVLVKGRNKSADQMLDMLENGVFEAVQRGYLQTLQVFITSENSRAQTVIESYSFTFEYNRGRHLSSIRLSPTNHAFVIENLRKSFKAAIRALLKSLKNLPHLPSRRNLGMSLTYSDECPLLYQPPRFVDAAEYEGDENHSMISGLWTSTSELLGEVDTGHHQVSLGVHLNHTNQIVATTDLQDRAMSYQLQTMQKTSSIQSNNLVSTLRDSECPWTDRCIPSKTRKPASTLSTPAPPGIDSGRQLKSSHERGEEPVTGLHDQHLATRGHEIHGPNIVEGVRDLHERGKRFSITPAKMAGLLVHAYALQHKGNQDANGDVFEAKALGEGTIKRLHRSGQVVCECGLRRRIKKMVFCELCNSWQHRDCYGLKGDDEGQTNLLEEHFCYTCLFFPENSQADVILHSIVPNRLAATYILSQPGDSIISTSDFVRSVLGPQSSGPTTRYELALQLMADASLLLREGEGFWRTQNIDESLRTNIESKYIRPLASIEEFHEACDGTMDQESRRRRVRQALEASTDGRDYTKAEGWAEFIGVDVFGREVKRWGYHPRLVHEDAGDGLARKRKASVTDSEATTAPQSARRRKISISRFLVNLSRSPSPGSVESADPLSDVGGLWVHSPDPSATA